MANENTESATNAYAQLNVGPGSPARGALMEKVQSDTNAGQLTTEGEAGSMAHGLTPGMKSWLGSYVGSFRSAAISEAKRKAEAIPVQKGAIGFVERVEIDKLKRHRAERRSAILGEFRKNYPNLVNDLETADAEYGRMKFDEGDRDAKVPNHFVEWGVILPLVMIPEAMLNFESFRRAPIIQSDFQALGVTLIVGFGIAIAAHMVGRFIRQINFFMRPDDDYQNRSGWPLWSIGGLLLVVSLCVVGYARYYYLLPLREEAFIVGQSPPNILIQIGSLLLGNFVVFLLGAAITFLLHDPNPDFSDKRRRLLKLRKKEERVRKKEVNAKLSAIDRSFKEGSDKVKRNAVMMRSNPQFVEVETIVSAIEAKDHEIAGALNEYREALASKLSPDFAFEIHYSSGDRSMGGEHVSVGDFKAMPSELLWG